MPCGAANNAGRTNLRDGIAPPDSSHPQFNKCPNDIDYQIEADYSGLIAPGLPNVSIELGEKFGRLMNYGEGVYAGQFIGALYGQAFFESDPVKLVENALKAIPAESQYAEVIRDVLAWHREDPNDWQKAWKRCEEKYCKDNYRGLRITNGGIDCRINGAYVVIGLLYGKGDLEQTPDDRLPLRARFRLQSLERGRRALHDRRLREAAGKVHEGTRPQKTLQLHRL